MTNFNTLRRLIVKRSGEEVRKAGPIEAEFAEILKASSFWSQKMFTEIAGFVPQFAVFLGVR